jgi:hypothetical protein
MSTNFMRKRKHQALPRAPEKPAAERAKRYRERKASRVTVSKSRVTSRNVTQAEAEAESSTTTIPTVEEARKFAASVRKACAPMGRG